MTGSVTASKTKTRCFPLCDMRVAVLQYEGTVQLGFLADGWEGGPRKLLSNAFIDTSTPDQLVALARYLRRLPLPAPIVPPEGAQ